MGCYYLTKERGSAKGEGKLFASPYEVRVAYDTGEIGLQARIRVRLQHEVIATTVGRVLLSEILPAEMDFSFVNRQMDKSSLTDLVAECYQRTGKERTVQLWKISKNLDFSMPLNPACPSASTICTSHC